MTFRPLDVGSVTVAETSLTTTRKRSWSGGEQIQVVRIKDL